MPDRSRKVPFVETPGRDADRGGSAVADAHTPLNTGLRRRRNFANDRSIALGVGFRNLLYDLNYISMAPVPIIDRYLDPLALCQ
jgi:hypothetical protein